jgi:hypothetical protein
MENNYEIIKKLEVVCEGENLEVTERIKTIKTLMDFVIGDSIIESTNDVLDCFNRFLNSDFDFVIKLLDEKYPLFNFHIVDSILIALTFKNYNCRSVPSFVTNLKLAECEGLTNLKGLPDGLESLEIQVSKNLTSLEGLPAGLESLNILRCESLTSLEGLPDSLKSLEITWCDRLTSLEGLPDGLKSLMISIDGLTSFEGLPDGLKSLKISWCENLTSLEGLPEGLENLEIDEHSRIKLDEKSLKMLEKFGV